MSFWICQYHRLFKPHMFRLTNSATPQHILRSTSRPTTRCPASRPTTARKSCKSTARATCPQATYNPTSRPTTRYYRKSTVHDYDLPHPQNTTGTTIPQADRLYATIPTLESTSRTDDTFSRASRPYLRHTSIPRPQAERRHVIPQVDRSLPRYGRNSHPQIDSTSSSTILQVRHCLLLRACLPRTESMNTTINLKTHRMSEFTTR